MALGHQRWLAAGPNDPAGQCPGTAAHVVFGIPVAVPEREELHELPRQVLVGRLGGVGLSVQPMHHRGVGQHRVGQRTEIAQRQTAQFMVLRRHVRRDPHFLGRGGKVVVPQQRQLLMNRLMDRYHAAQPPMRQLGHLVGQLAIELFANRDAGSLSGAAQSGKRRHGCRPCAGVRLGVCNEGSIDVA